MRFIQFRGGFCSIELEYLCIAEGAVVDTYVIDEAIVVGTTSIVGINLALIKTNVDIVS